MSVKQDVNEIKEEFEEISFAMEMLQFSKDQATNNNKILEKTIRRLVIIIIILILCLAGSVVYNIFLLNDVSTISTETTQEVSDVNNINGNIVNNGDAYDKDKANSKN